MDTPNFVAMGLAPGQFLKARGFTADPWQQEVLLSRERQLLLSRADGECPCCRRPFDDAG
jgi:hypothetical protein